MTAYMAGLNIAYGRDETRSFVRKRLVALVMVACIGAAFLLIVAAVIIMLTWLWLTGLALLLAVS